MNTQADALRGLIEGSVHGSDATGPRQELLSFRIEEEEYAVDILRVREIRGWGPVTRIPRMPDYVRGVLNLRGAIVPVIDLRMRFGLEPLEYGPTTVVVILHVEAEDRVQDIGVVVDAVSDVYAVDPGRIQPPPEFGTHLDAGFLKGLISQNDHLIIVVDVDRVLDTRTLASAASASEATAVATD
ncbi:MAG: chemotaxis protein CheW [Pseudomonadales bacterium]|jgi:purine-binding chemotaxis protein CheW|nr:chemotaxis protein CheW [Pseudomonadales bacterium]